MISKFKLFVIISVISFGQLSAQKLYLTDSFKVKKRTFTYHKLKLEKNLKLDLYRPKKLKTIRPLIIYVHGGGFSGGKRNDDVSKTFSTEFTKFGYNVASISYRLTMKGIGFGCSTKADLKIKAFDEASKDLSYAIQYLLKKQKRFKIDTSKIILVGSSAGAEAILHFAYAYNNTILNDDVKIAGLVSMAGALTTLKNINSKTAIPTQLFHGTKDELVPYNIAPHHYCKTTDEGYLELFGSRAIADHLKKIDKSYYLYTVKNGDHSWNSRPIFEAKEHILDFLYFDVLQNKQRKTEVNTSI
ncbi:alpha/beta hydrolase fold domain-containing protein [Polaribacter sp. MED152]|uniref:alpha/beta hydrolase fold domain-containing protein n=1 Tax=Polaribacter sp. MED152 TaxID=313598 RepID=UPI000068CCC7|nr:alpha/beta hydrolase fold domain-containing protein [Polaribacter sp. MED152]EAQ41902.1 phospholipase/carboxylesterase [Polaribacter sp. MED152]